MKRTRKTFINVVTSAVTYAANLVTAFVVQRVLVETMGTDYNGINGLFGSIISMMSLADLGIGTAIIYHMYRPMAEKNERQINSLMRFYRRCYVVISGIVLLLGVVVALFIPLLVGNVEIKDSIYLIYALFLLDCLCSYFLAYKKSLLYADLMNYVPDTIYFLTYIVQNVLQVYVLLAFQNFILFLVVKTLGKCVPNLFISLYIRKKYPFTAEKNVAPVDREIKEDIITKVKGLLCHKLGKIIITGSDSIVITGILGIKVMSLYTNYRLVIAGITALLNRMFETLTNSVGNFLLASDRQRRLDVYKKIDFLNFWCFGCVAAGMYAVLQPLVTLWLGEDFLFSKPVVFVLVVNFYLEGMRASVNTFKEAAGIFHEDRRIPLTEAFINLISSVILAKLLGVAGVFLGTILSTAAAYLYSYPKYVCKPLFNMSYRQYVGMTARHLTVFLLILGVTEYCIRGMENWNLWLRMFLSGTAAVIIFHVFFLLLYGKSRELQYYVNLVKGKIWS
ncbi:MAG: hypothetical protein NC541_09360 [bacterium]|nr:hypothetical protein [bacterium]